METLGDAAKGLGVRAEAKGDRVRHERAGGRRERAHEDHQGQLREIVPRAEAVEGDDHVGRSRKRDAGLFDRDDDEEDDVLMEEHEREQRADCLANESGQRHRRGRA